MNFERRYFGSSEYSFRAVEEGEKRFIEGYASVFGVRSKLILERGELFYEEINPGSFRDVLAKEGLDVIFTYNHNKDIVLARTTSKTLELSEDKTGLFFRAQIDKYDTEASNLWIRVKRGDIFENSFAFRVAENDYTWTTTEDQIPLRTINRVSDLRDVSAVTYAAYPETSVNARELAEINKEDKEDKEDEAHEDNNDRERFLMKIKIIQIENNL